MPDSPIELLDEIYRMTVQINTLVEGTARQLAELGAVVDVEIQRLTALEEFFLQRLNELERRK